ncbi:MAG: RloB domain-containing protein [Deltaproteobacteria bacterium]|nr:RloB domain-containing protein [Deltaproteobacteria bacterium]
MGPEWRKFQRDSGQLPYRKMFFIAAEGTVTEPQYFNICKTFIDLQPVIRVKCLNVKHSSPPYVLKRMNRCLKEETLKESDEAWLVVDNDRWTEAQLTQLHDWSRKRNNYNFALSNPKFEYWLLLHFEDGHRISTSKECSDRLKGHLPGYDKGIPSGKITREMITKAIERAKQRDNPPCPDWPRKPGTTVYRLVENILNAPDQAV